MVVATLDAVEDLLDFYNCTPGGRWVVMAVRLRIFLCAVAAEMCYPSEFWVPFGFLGLFAVGPRSISSSLRICSPSVGVLFLSGFVRLHCT